MLPTAREKKNRERVALYSVSKPKPGWGQESHIFLDAASEGRV